LFVYNTWYPFRTFVNDSLIREVARAASECGIQEFIIDDGWQYNSGARTTKKGWGGNYGDWLVDRNKFPGDLTSVFDYIRSLGMKPGLWMSIGSATEDSRVYQSHPEWFVKNKNGKTGNLHTGSEAPDFYTSCFGTEWFSYIKSVILNLVKEHGLAYAKLDFSVVTSAYINDPSISGCYATDHPFHRDHEESFIVIYENVLRLFDELHAEAPDLFIDCTFETAGKLQLQDYAVAKHAEGNWLSNIEDPFPTGALRMRQMAWWRSPALPAGSLVIGNLPLDSKNFEFNLKSLIGTLPIVLGDPRKLSLEQRAGIRKWADWMKRMQEKYDYMSFRQDLPGFGEPREGFWDAWARINTDNKKGGIIGVFRQGALERNRTVFVPGLDPLKQYMILIAPEDKEVKVSTGKQLSEEGFPVNFGKNYDGQVFEIREIL
jgi:alpha-galactosidase